MTECKNCKKYFNVTDAEDFEQFCSAKCESELKHDLVEFRREEAEQEFLEERKAEMEREEEKQ